MQVVLEQNFLGPTFAPDAAITAPRHDANTPHFYLGTPKMLELSLILLQRYQKFLDILLGTLF